VKQVFRIPTIKCEGCVESIRSQVTRLPGIQRVTGDAQTKSIVVHFEEHAVSEDAIRSAIQRAGHRVDV